jgi:hypothetical protein
LGFGIWDWVAAFSFFFFLTAKPIGSFFGQLLHTVGFRRRDSFPKTCAREVWTDAPRPWPLF